MPKPANLQEAQDRCVKGEMRVEIEYKATGGNPLSAKMVSGDEFVRESVEAAAMNTRLQPVRHADPKATFRGILLYNFLAKSSAVYCIDTKRILNDRVKIFPVSKISSRSQRPAKETDVTLSIVVDGAGKVFYAKADRDTPEILKANAEKIAIKVMFSQSPHGIVKARGSLVLRFHSDGRVTLPQIPAQK